MIVTNPKELTMKRVRDHANEALEHFHFNQVVGCFLQGSQNYGLETPNSDVDTKLIVVPSFEEVCLNKKPVSTTHVRENNEHTDWKDIRLYMENFRKQNLNFLEILFTPYALLNPAYSNQWRRLVERREDIAHMNPFRAVKSMKGIALEKFHAMEKPYPSKIDLIERFGYDGKQVHHLLRVDDYLTRYIEGESYESCLKPSPEKVSRMLEYKALNQIPFKEAKEEAYKTLAHVEALADSFCASRKDEENEEVRALLDDVCYNIMKISVEKELQK